MSKTIVKCEVYFRELTKLIDYTGSATDVYGFTSTSYKYDITGLFINGVEYTQYGTDYTDFINNTSTDDPVYVKVQVSADKFNYYVKLSQAPSNVLVEQKDYFATEQIRENGKVYKPYLQDFPKVKDEIKLKEIIVPKSMDISLDNGSRYFQDWIFKYSFIGGKIVFDNFSVIINNVSFGDVLKLSGREVLSKLEATYDGENYSYTIDGEVETDTEYKRVIYGRVNGVKTKFNRANFYNNFYNGKRNLLRINRLENINDLENWNALRATGNELESRVGDDTLLLKDVRPGDTIEFYDTGALVGSGVVDYVESDKMLYFTTTLGFTWTGYTDTANKGLKVIKSSRTNVASDPGGFEAWDLSEPFKAHYGFFYDGVLPNVITGVGTRFAEDLRIGDVLKLYKNNELAFSYTVSKIINDNIIFVAESIAENYILESSDDYVEVEYAEKRVLEEKRFDICSHKLAQITEDFDFNAGYYADAQDATDKIFTFEINKTDEMIYLFRHLKTGDYIDISENGNDPFYYKVVSLDYTSDPSYYLLRIQSLTEATTFDEIVLYDMSEITTIPINNVMMGDNWISPYQYTLYNTDDGAYIVFDDGIEYPYYPSTTGTYFSEFHHNNFERETINEGFTHIELPMLRAIMAGSPARAKLFEDSTTNQTYSDAEDFHYKYFELPLEGDDPYSEPAKLVFVNDSFYVEWQQNGTGGWFSESPKINFFRNVSDTDNINEYNIQFDKEKDILVPLYFGQNTKTYTTSQLFDLIVDAVNKTGRFFAHKTSTTELYIYSLFPHKYVAPFVPGVGEDPKPYNGFNNKTINGIELLRADVGTIPNDFDVLSQAKEWAFTDWLEEKNYVEIFYEEQDYLNDVPYLIGEVIEATENTVFFSQVKGSTTYRDITNQSDTYFDGSVLKLIKNAKRITEETEVFVNISHGKVSGDTNYPFLKSPKMVIKDLLIKAGLEDDISDGTALVDGDIKSFEDFSEATDSNFSNYKNIEETVGLVIPEKIDDDLKAYKDIFKELNQCFRTYLSRSIINGKWGIDFISGAKDPDNTSDPNSVYIMLQNVSGVYTPKEITEDKTFDIKMAYNTKNVINKIEYKYNYSEKDGWTDGEIYSNYAKSVLGIEKTLRVNIYTADETEALSLVNSLLRLGEKPDTIFRVTTWKTLDYEVGDLVKLTNKDLPNYLADSSFVSEDQRDNFWYGIINKKDVKGDRIIYEITDFGGLLNEALKEQ